MPLTHKGTVIKRALEKEYGKKHGEEVLYAGKNSGRFTGIDSSRRATLDDVVAACDAYDSRSDQTHYPMKPDPMSERASAGHRDQLKRHQKMLGRNYHPDRKYHG